MFTSDKDLKRASKRFLLVFINVTASRNKMQNDFKEHNKSQQSIITQNPQHQQHNIWYPVKENYQVGERRKRKIYSIIRRKKSVIETNYEITEMVDLAQRQAGTETPLYKCCVRSRKQRKT